MQIIDAHAHILDRSWVPGPVRYAWARQAGGRRVDPKPIEQTLANVMRGQSDPDGVLTVAAFRSAGVSSGVFPFVDWSMIGGGDPEAPTMAEVLRHVEGVAATHEGLFWYLTGVDPRSPVARDSLAALENRHCIGVKLYPAAGWDISDPAHHWVLDEITERGVPIMVHTSPLGGDPLVTPLSRPAALVPAIARYPEQTWVFAHAGFEAWWLEAVDLAQGWRGTVLDISMWQRVANRDYADFRRRMALVLERVGAHRVLFGSDIMRGERSDPDGRVLREWIDRMVALGEPYEGAPPVCSREELELMMCGNAQRIYGLGRVDGNDG
ncbi:amidohydrolase [Nocardioides sp. zg-ZUI104]|uniref:amidohydrolase family protein n=1 Tax=Nocardioides faecalis TaxID=2803858 RepID=UPI001BCCD524|nr:amidohydrolase family protein [Nocardioides faecalis]MBS4754540.1 amidohydrolase [Nocardioides faecalis]